MTIQELCEQTVKPLPVPSRLRLAQMILNDISPASVVDDGEEWTEEDCAEFSRASWGRVEKALGEAADD